MNSRIPLPVPATHDLLDQIHFEPESGKIWLHESRMLMLHASVLGGLRRELINSFGIERAKGILIRFGYESGRRDAELAKRLRPDLNQNDSFVVGPQLHTLEGLVNVKPIRLSFDVEAGTYYGEFDWHNSWEGEQHIADYGASDEGVCWTLLGYASGYTSYYMGRRILFKETQCIACGHSHCVNIGRPAEEWDDRETLERYLDADPVIDEITLLRSQIDCLRNKVKRNDQSELEQFTVGRSIRFAQVCELLGKAAQSKVSILLQGETGVGKEVLARHIHRRSDRAEAPFVAVNCACIPPDLIEAELFGVEKGAFTGALQSREGRFERADSGTLFLDEVVELSPRAQASLLRILQESEYERVGDSRTRRVDVRVVAACNEDLQQAVSEGRFRADLFFRLNVFPVQIPPLRERREDIAPLVDSFLERYHRIYNKRTLGLTDRALNALMSYHWPGNIRELENMIERGIILTDNNRAIEVGCFFPSLSEPGPGSTQLNANGRLTGNPDESATASLDSQVPLASKPLASGPLSAIPQSPAQPNATAAEPETGTASTDSMPVSGAAPASAAPALAGQLADTLLDNGIGLEALEELMIERALSRCNNVVSHAARELGLSRPAFAYRMKKHDNKSEPASS